MIIFSNCFKCTYYIGGKTCLAFPHQNIPNEIFENKKEHNKILDNQIGKFKFKDFTKLSTKKEPKEIEKAYTEGIYADTPQNRKLGRVGMSYKDYYKKLKNVKKDFFVLTSQDNAASFLIEDHPITQEEAIKKATEMCESLVRENNLNSYSYELESQSENTQTGLSNTWIKITSQKKNNKIYTKVFDFSKGEFLRNDELKERFKETDKKLKKEEKDFKALKDFYKEVLETRNKTKNG